MAYSSDNKAENYFELHDVSKIFKQGQEEQLLFSHVSLKFNQGESYALTGVSGSGKTTLLSLLVGLEEPTTGKILYNDQSVFQLAQTQPQLFFHDIVGIIFQSAYLIKELTVLENVILKGLVRGENKPAAQQKGLELLSQVGLKDKAHSMPGTLSGGEQQRVALVRALYTRPKFLLADEPTAHLDETHRNQLIAILKEYQKNYTMGLIVSSHDPYVYECMDNQFVLKSGELLELKISNNSST